ncbi:MAG: DNA-processing protein DprA, partial [Thiohalomonadales bacterium]
MPDTHPEDNISVALSPCPDQEAWLLLIRTPGLGPRRLQKLLAAFAGPAEILGSNHRQLASIVSLPQKTLHALANPNRDALVEDQEWLSQQENHLISVLSPLYPPQLKQIADPPAVLFCRGNPALLAQPQLAMVGSRNPDHYGLESAFDFAKHLNNNGLIITSGLALGIDGASHKGAIAATGETIAVAATGLDRVYPARHKELAHSIAECGVLVSEQPLGTAPIANQFPRRNRIISGLSLGTFVIQAALQSGSLITARLALEHDREVFALPGSIHNPLSKGCHQLIRDGAKLVETTQDILVELAPQLHSYLNINNRFTNTKNNGIIGAATPVVGDRSLNDQQSQLLQIIGFEP